MGFEDYQIILSPRPESLFACSGTPTLIRTVAGEIQQEWPAFAPDDLETHSQNYPARPDTVFLVYETSRELFQLLISVNASQNNSLYFSLRFAYCNPRSVYEPFCQVIIWLMNRYRLVCYPMRDLAPPDQEESKVICFPADIRRLLIPSMDYNRRFWFLDAQTEEEAPLRPGDATARFIMPRLQLAHSVLVETN